MEGRYLSSLHPKGSDSYIFAITLRHEVKRLRIEAPGQFLGVDEGDEFQADFQCIIGPVKEFLKAEREKPGYRGLSITAIRQLARLVRVPPREGVRVLVEGKWKKRLAKAKQELWAGSLLRDRHRQWEQLARQLNGGRTSFLVLGLSTVEQLCWCGTRVGILQALLRSMQLLTTREMHPTAMTQMM